MRLAYLVDVHEVYDAVPRALARIGAVDVLLVGGDLTTGGSVEQAGAAVERWQALVPRLYAVAGNMDSAAIDARLSELGVGIDGRGVFVDGIGVFGLSAAPLSPLDTPYELPDEELERRIARGFADVATAATTIFCPHAPPYGTACDRLASGEHVGSGVVRDFVERVQPRLVLCGHIHESRGEDTIGRSQIVNPGPAHEGHYALVELEPSGKLVVVLDAD